MGEHLSLLELNKIVQKTLDKTLEPTYWVVVEIAELRVNQNGHCYLELVEKKDNSIIAKSRATIWSYTYRNLSLWFERMTNESLKPGLKILCNLSVQFHEVYGLSYNIKDIDANYTLGERERKRQQVIQQLLEDGVFEMNKELSTPRVLTQLAIISSPAAAGYEDFMNQLVNNSYGYTFNCRLFKATMQGESASESIINALQAAHQSNVVFDAVLIIRGGGSALDLDCFDDYELNFTAAQFPIPILTGIGHERDQSILDIIAYKSLKTPTALAEWVIGKSLDFESQLIERMQKIALMVDRRLQAEKGKLDNSTTIIKNAFQYSLQSQRHTLTKHSERIKALSRHAMEKYNSQIKVMEEKIKFLNPENVLKRGYSLSYINGRKVTTENVKEGDIIETRILSSTLKSSVLEIIKNNEETEELQ